MKDAYSSAAVQLTNNGCRSIDRMNRRDPVIVNANGKLRTSLFGTKEETPQLSNLGTVWYFISGLSVCSAK